MAGLISISSSAEWANILKTHNIVIADFYADWCGPCKMIAPHFERLAKEYAVPKKVAFCKINVDNHSGISKSCGVSAMPTFVIFHGGKAINTIRGANPPALTSAITDALKLKDKGGAGEMFKSPGRSLGGGAAQPAAFDLSSIFSSIFDPYIAAQNSRFNIVNPSPQVPQAQTSGQRGTVPARRTGPSAAYRTLSDLGKEE